MQNTKSTIYDVLIIGAGISGIGMAYWLQEKCPQKSFALLEARDVLGGTWSLFQYPGVRSDSDMFTFGYRFKPWQNPQSLSEGKDILAYLQETVEENDLEKYIQFGHQFVAADWSDETQLWTLRVKHQGVEKEMRCRFVSLCSGYYDYEEAHRPTFKGENDFQGKIILPQFWDKNFDYTNKKIVVVGSGATAVTIVPNMAKKGAAHVTMLQRSPTYVMNLPNRNGLFVFFRKWLPNAIAYRLTRGINILGSIATFSLSKWFPKQAKGFIMKEAAKQLPPDFEVDKHFNPAYNPWDQRLCVVPDGDLFEVIKQGKAAVETDHISHFTKNGIQLVSGKHLEADAIVLATGLKIKLIGGAIVRVNDQPININDSLIYKGMMVSDIPNIIYAFGYTNASWTLKVDLTANYLCKLLNYMDRKGYEVVVPLKPKTASEEPFLNLNSGYIQRAKKVLPKQGKKRPWRVYQSYLVDMLATRFGRIADDILKFR